MDKDFLNLDLILLCERSVDRTACEIYILGNLVLIYGVQRKISGLRFNDGNNLFSAKRVLSEILISSNLCGVIPKETQYRQDLFQIQEMPFIEGYVIVNKLFPKYQI